MNRGPAAGDPKGTRHRHWLPVSRRSSNAFACRRADALDDVFVHPGGVVVGGSTPAVDVGATPFPAPTNERAAADVEHDGTRGGLAAAAVLLALMTAYTISMIALAVCSAPQRPCTSASSSSGAVRKTTSPRLDRVEAQRRLARQHIRECRNRCGPPEQGEISLCNHRSLKTSKS